MTVDSGPGIVAPFLREMSLYEWPSLIVDIAGRCTVATSDAVVGISL